MWALCLLPRAKGWGGVSGHWAGGHRPASHSLLHRPPLLQPPPRAPRSPAPPQLSSLSCPHPRHRPSSSAVSSAQRCCPPEGGGAATQPLIPGRLRRESPRSAPQLPRAPRASPSPPGSYLPGGSVRPGSAAAARLLGPREPRRRRRRGEPGAPPRLQTQRRPFDPGTRVGAGPRAHRDGAAGQRPRPRAYRAGGSARRRCWGSVRDSDNKATWGLWYALGPASAGRLKPLQRSSGLCTPLATARPLPHQKRSDRRSSRSLHLVSRLFK